jgi:nucleotide-binding universal stress UspA family protein
MYQKILIPLDGSALAEAVLAHARALAQPDSELALLRVAMYPTYDYVFSSPAVAATLTEEIEDESEKYLRDVAARLQAEGFKTSIAVTGGPVADAILEYADAVGADLIAMSTHGRSGVARWLIGSVADRVVRGSPVPVLLVRPAPDAIAIPRTAEAVHAA